MPIDATIAPITRTEQYLDGIANETTEGIPPFPITREEMYLDAIANGNADNIPVPITRTEMYLNAIAQNSGGGGGGGGDAWTLIGSAEYAVNTSNTSATDVGTINLTVDEITANDIIYIAVRDKSGKKPSYLYGTDAIFAFPEKSSPGATNSVRLYNCCTVMGANTYAPGKYSCAASQYGVYASSIDVSAKTVKISAKYNGSSTGTIDGTYKVEVYKLTPPFTMFE